MRSGHTLRLIYNAFTRRLRRITRPVECFTHYVGTKISSCSFITLHHAYIILTCLIVSGVFYGVSRPIGSVSYPDCLFLVVSGMTLTGLNTVNLSTINTTQQVILFLLLIVGSSIFVSGFVVHVRKSAFEHRFAHIAALRQQRTPHFSTIKRRLSGSRSRADKSVNLSHEDRSDRDTEKLPGHEETMNVSPCGVEEAAANVRNPREAEDEITRVQSQTQDSQNSPAPHITFGPDLDRPKSHPCIPTYGVGARSDYGLRKQPSNQSIAPSDSPTEIGRGSTLNRPPFLSSGLVSRNSQFSHLTEKERKELGGYEYKAICLLSWLVPAYFILFQLLGCLGLGAYVANNRPSPAVKNGLNPWWVGSFNAVSAFNNSGMSLLDANMVAFQTSIYMLITMSLLILAGNTCYPIFLRLIVWTFLKLLPKSEQWDDFRRTLQFLLDHPRRCYTNLFPSRHTRWLLAAVIVLNGTDWVAFELLNLGNKAIEVLPAGIRTLDGLFQAFAVRSGGFYVVPISSVRISLQVLYVIMMYVSVYPVVITMRNTNVYEERSLGIYADDPDYVAKQSASKKGFFARTWSNAPLEETTQYFVRHQLRAQLSHDIWGIVLAVFLISAFEAGKFESEPALFSVFNIIFETVSAYGCVGISVGLPDQAYSFAGALTVQSKLVLCAVMIRGRHRGLPVAIDKAILLPREELDEVEEHDAMRRMERSVSRGRMV